MLTIPDLVEQEVAKSPFLEEALYHGLINLSSLARYLKSDIQKKLDQKSLRDRPITEAAMIMALARLQRHLSKKSSQLAPLLQKIRDITVRSNLIEYTLTNSRTLVLKQVKLTSEMVTFQNSFLTTSNGVFETSFFISSNLALLADELFKGEELRRKTIDLASITLILPQEVTPIPGVYYTILKTLAWRGINFTEVVSSFTELTIFLDKANTNEAFSVLRNLSEEL